jgi:ATP-binding cassette, subfamily B, bacterial
LKAEVKVNEIDTKLSGYLADTVSNNFNISLFSNLKFEQKNFEEISEDWRTRYTRHWNINILNDGIQSILMIGLEIFIVYFAIKFWKEGTLSIGEFILLQSLLTQIFGNMWSLARSLRQIGKGYSDAKEMMDILKIPHEVQDVEGAKNLIVSEGKIDIKNLDFAYNKDKIVFDDFSLLIEPGRKIALVSKSGEGKSTLMKLLLRLYNIEEGMIFIDDQDIMNVTLHSLRKSISLVPQDPILFHRTLAENIKYGKQDATFEEIVEASKKAHCHEFIEQLPEKYDTFVGERGIKLSGGERQRVAIARAILENAPILILDEATSALDSESEHLIQEALKELMKNKTTIAIAHRLSTIIQMDEIIVIEKGRVKERGTHSNLLRNDTSHYKKLWEIQAGGFENI